MKKQPKSMNIILIVILFVISVLFIVYGVYVTKTAIEYVAAYQSSIYVSETTRLQYIIESSIMYYGFGLLFIICAFIFITFNRMQRNIYEALIHSENRTVPSYDTNSTNSDDQQIEFLFDEPKTRRRRS